MRAIVQAPDFLDGQFPVDRRAHPGDAAAAPTPAARSPPTRSAATSGTISRRRPTRSCPRSARSRCTIRSTATPSHTRCRRRARLRAAASLISVWSTAPFLLNNTVGPFNRDPSVEARMRVVRRLDRADAVAGEAREGSGARRQGPGPASIPHHRAQLPQIPAATCRTSCSALADGALAATGWLPWLFDHDGDLKLGPIPKGTPVNLLANIELLSESTGLEDRAAHEKLVASWCSSLKAALEDAARGCHRRAGARRLRADRRRPAGLSKCPDFVVNKRPLLRHRNLEPTTTSTR